MDYRINEEKDGQLGGRTDKGWKDGWISTGGEGWMDRFMDSQW